MIGAIITLSIISFVALCATITLLILYRSELKSHSLTQRMCKNDEHILGRLAQAIEGVENYIRAIRLNGLNTK